ncbi:MAG: helix-turn-helix transcriptional regulator [Candidatus Dormibacteria bacterium]
MSIDVIVRASGLKAKRKQRDLTQRGLAKLVGVTQNYIAAIEADDRRAGPELRRKLMRALDAAFDELFVVVMIDPEAPRGHAETVLEPASRSRAV